MNPSIFNDVIGPVMRGPSSSHTAASWRIARMCLEILDDSPGKALIEFDKDGAWATNYEEQGTVMGINAGLLGLEITDDRMKVCNQILKETELTINYQISSFKNPTCQYCTHFTGRYMWKQNNSPCRFTWWWLLQNLPTQ